MEFFGRIVLLIALVKTGHGFTIKESEDKVDDKFYITKGGPDLELPCTIQGDDFDPGQYSIRWEKAQPERNADGSWEENPDEHGISVAKEIEGAFAVDGRYRIDYSYSTGQPRQYKLVIRDPMLKDSGRYRCFGKDGPNAMRQMIYYVYVETPPSEIVLFGQPDSSKTSNDTDEETDALVYYTNKQGSIGCTTYGAFPSQIISFFIRDDQGNDIKQILGGFKTTKNQEDQLVGDVLGLQIYNFEETKQKDDFEVEPEYQGAKIVCEVKVSDKVPLGSASRPLEIKAAPQFVDEFCDEMVYAESGDEDVAILCRYNSTSPVSSVSWKARTTGEELSAFDQKSDMYSTSNNLQSGGDGTETFEARLEIKKAVDKSFQTYRLRVENEVGWSDIKDIVLKQGEKPEPVCDPEEETCGAPRSAAVFTVAICMVSIATAAFVML